MHCLVQRLVLCNDDGSVDAGKDAWHEDVDCVPSASIAIKIVKSMGVGVDQLTCL